MSYTTRRLWYSNMRRFRGFGFGAASDPATHSRSETACALPVFVPNRGPHPTIRPASLAPPKARNPGWGMGDRRHRPVHDVTQTRTRPRMQHGTTGSGEPRIAEDAMGEATNEIGDFKFDDVPGHSCGGIRLTNSIRYGKVRRLQLLRCPHG
jgi:hypothetical protein